MIEEDIEKIIEDRYKDKDDKTKEFIRKALRVHENKYDYSKSKYINAKTKTTIICSIHGDFLQTPANHLRKRGCQFCGGTRKLTTEEFIEKAREIHDNDYDYSKVNYVNCQNKITIKCNTCGNKFNQMPANHLHGKGCPVCGTKRSHELYKHTTEEFIERAKEIHGNDYDYSKVNYINSRTKVIIKCNTCGNEFEQIPRDHLYSRCGCPNCKSSKLELECRNYLNDNNIIFEEQKTWNWLIYESNMRVDFYIPSLNLVIECQGEQHFESIDFFGGDDNYTLTIERDKTKNKLLNEHGIRILYFSNLGDDYSYPYKVFNSLEELLKDNTETTIIT